MRTSRTVALAATVLLFVVSCGGGGSGGSSSSPVSGSGGDWIIPANEVFDGGPGQDGIPSIDFPVFENVQDNTYLHSFDRVVGVLVDGEYRAYPHRILNWHEVVNDAAGAKDFVLSYCPLTGSALGWDVPDSWGNPQFGVSGLLYNSNLILYDRGTGSRWSQMLELSVWGERTRQVPGRIRFIETNWITWKTMFPDSQVLTTDTGHNRDYADYPYGFYLSNEELLFPVSREDNRLHPKTRVVGVHSGSSSKVYQIEGFGDTTQAINEQFAGEPIVVVGNTLDDIATIFSRELADGTILDFTPVQDQLPVVMTDSEGNTWDIFGHAVSGPRIGTQLETTQSFTAFWFAWATFFDNTEIHFN